MFLCFRIFTKELKTKAWTFFSFLVFDFNASSLKRLGVPLGSGMGTHFGRKSLCGGDREIDIDLLTYGLCQKCLITLESQTVTTWKSCGHLRGNQSEHGWKTCSVLAVPQTLNQGSAPTMTENSCLPNGTYYFLNTSVHAPLKNSSPFLSTLLHARCHSKCFTCNDSFVVTYLHECCYCPNVKEDKRPSKWAKFSQLASGVAWVWTQGPMLSKCFPYVLCVGSKIPGPLSVGSGD